MNYKKDSLIKAIYKSELVQVMFWSLIGVVVWAWAIERML